MTLAEPPRPVRAVTRPLSQERLDKAVARSAAGFSLAFLAQSIPAMATQLPGLRAWWSVGAISAVAAGMVLALIASVAGRRVRLAHGIAAVAYTLALMTWPFAVVDPTTWHRDSFVLYFTLTAGMVMGAIAVDSRLGAIIVAVALPTLYAVIRVSPQGGDVSGVQATLDSVYSLLLGGVIVITIFVLRAAASSVDAAQQTALARYSHAVQQHAIEAERVQVDAIVHDSVLTTLLSAARAETPEAMQLAATMAGNAIGHLRAAAVEPEAQGEVSALVVSSRIDDTASTMTGRLERRFDDLSGVSMPVPVAEALYSASVQALVNSFQHAGGEVDRWVMIRPWESHGIEIEVGDRGRGFDPATVPDERLGVRVSIGERIATVGGTSEIASAPGQGTVVTLRWSPDGHGDDQEGDEA